MDTSAANNQGNHQQEATQATPKKATVSMGNKSFTIEGRAAGLVNGLAFVASAVLATLFVVQAIKSQREQ